MNGWGEPITGPYETQGKCDGCNEAPGALVNGLAPCACFSGFGASAEKCSCPWGYQQRARQRKAAP